MRAPKRIDSITATNVALRDQYLILGDETIRLPTDEELRAYLDQVRDAYARWADQPPEPDPPLFQQSDHPDTGPDAYIPVEGRPLPMRVAQFRATPGADQAPAHDLLDAVGEARHTVILGEPGSGKTTALERLAWATANASLAAEPEAGPRSIPLFVRLADYQGEPDLIPLLRRAFNRRGLAFVSDLSVKATLHATDARFALLLDGLNEIERAFAERSLGAIHRHLDDFPQHVVHLTCRTADFDQVAAQELLPADTQLWEVQLLSDDIRYWDDPQGQSDVRDYLRRHLGNDAGKRLYERLRADERLRSLARLPLFLRMFKEVAGGGDGDLPADRGGLLRQFVRSPRLWGRTPAALRSRAERSLEALAWRMQNDGRLEMDEDALYEALAQVRGPRGYELDAMRACLRASGLLVSLGGERYRLLHQMIQEYGAAAHLVR